MVRIPVYQVTIREYKIKDEETKPDFSACSSKIIQCLRKHFMGRKIAFRLLRSGEHEGLALNNLISTIKQLGTDRYNPHRIGDRYDNLEGKHIDFFALDFLVGEKEGEENVTSALESFFYWPIFSGKNPVRVDLGIVYDFRQLNVVEHRYVGREKEVKRDGFSFKYPDRRPMAVLAVIKIL